MKVYLASAGLDDVLWATRRRLIDGVLTTHALLGQHDVDSEREQLFDICRTAQGPVFVTVHAVTGAEAYRDARELAKLSDQIVVQIPFVEDVIESIHRLTADGVRVAATLVFTAAQALLAARAGVVSVVVPVDELEAAGHDATSAIRELRAVFTASDSEADIIAQRPGNAAQFAGCAAAGADAIAVAPDVLRALLVHPLTDRGVDRFLHALSRQHGTWSFA